jgi:hypothetical protein
LASVELFIPKPSLPVPEIGNVAEREAGEDADPDQCNDPGADLGFRQVAEEGEHLRPVIRGWRAVL